MADEATGGVFELHRLLVEELSELLRHDDSQTIRVRGHQALTVLRNERCRMVQRVVAQGLHEYTAAVIVAEPRPGADGQHSGS